MCSSLSVSVLQGFQAFVPCQSEFLVGLTSVYLGLLKK